MSGKRVLIAGAGSIGSVLGGFLRRAGRSVTLLGRAQHLDAIRTRGLFIDGLWGDHRVTGFDTATTSAELGGPFDAIFVPVKSYDTRATAEVVASFLAPGGVMISLQNGLGNVEVVESIVGSDRTLGARVIFGAAIPEPGRVSVTVFVDPTAIGALRAGENEELGRAACYWAEEIHAAGVPAAYTDRLQSLLWAKVFYNAALNPLSALLRVHYGRLPERPDSRAIMDAAIDEVFRVARAEKVPLPWRTDDEYRAEFYGRLVPVTYDHRSSMLQDLERGRRTEVDAINGEVWRRGAAHGIETPVNEMLTRLIRLTARQRVDIREEGE